MFGFDENVEITKTPTQEFCDYLKKIIECIDGTKNYDKTFYRSLMEIYEKANAIVVNLSYTEQAKVNTHWSSMTMLLKQTMPMFYAAGKMMQSSIDMNVPNIRTWCLSLLGQLS